MAPPPVIRLHPDDNVVIARVTLLPGTPLAEGATAIQRIPAGHKASVRRIGRGEAIRRYGQIIGFASSDIVPGLHVHVQNCEMGDFAKDYAYGVDAKDTAYFDPPATFQGIRRPDGKVATRNYIGILTSVNCSAHVAGLVANMFQRNPFTGDDPLADYPHVDGVVALTHKTGCGMTQDEPLRVLRRTLAGYARHPNFSHVIVLGLGCEVNQIGGLMQEQRLAGRLRSLDGGRNAQNRGRRRRLRPRSAGGIERRAARDSARQCVDRGVAMRRLRRILRGLRESRAWLCERFGRGQRRLGHFVGNAGNLWCRALADPPRGVA
jgi:altronate hydrolase